MRDHLCKEDYLKHTIEIDNKTILKKIIKMDQMRDDAIKGIQRYPLPPEKVLFNTQQGIIQIYRDLIRAQYSLGVPCEEIEELYYQMLPYIEVVGFDKYGYIYMVQYLALGILLEIPKDKMQILVDKIDEAKVDDLLFDYLVIAYGLKRKMKSTQYYDEIPYRGIIEIAEAAKEDWEKASMLLKEYTEKKYLKGHADCGWTTAHKEGCYLGYWSYEAGAVAKVLGLKDDELMKSIHYPYDLVHYKNNMQVNQDAVDELGGNDIKQDADFAEKIPANADLEKIVPKRFRGIVNSMITDYNNLSEQDFYDKYNLKRIWYAFHDYSKENKKGLLGTLIVFLLVEQGYILQLDYKEELGDYEENIVNYWETDDTVLIQFELDNDQEYYAKVPAYFNLKKLYEIKIVDCN